MSSEFKSKKIKELSALARGQLTGRFSIAIPAVLIITVIETVASGLTQVNTLSVSETGYLLSIIITLVVDLLMGIFIYGESVFFLKIARGNQEVSFSDIFSGFKGLTDKTIVVQSVFTLFSLLSLVPTLLIHYGLVFIPEEYLPLSYVGRMVLELIILFVCQLYFGMSFYVLSDHPEWTPSEVLRESLLIMHNKKGKLLLTYLSVIPLFIVSILTFGIGIFWFMPYMQTLLANFYLDSVKEDAWSPFNETKTPSDGSTTLDIRL